MKVAIEISSDCNLCGRCAQYCPTGVFRITNNHLEVSQDRCIYCKGCEIICPPRAISVKALDEGILVVRRRALASIRPN